MTRRQWGVGVLGAVVVAGAATVVPTTATTAAPPELSFTKQVDPALGNGLGRLLAQSEHRSYKRQAGLRIDQESLTIRDAQGRVLIQLTPRSEIDRAAFRKQAEALGLVVQAVDARVGTLEGFTPLSAVRALAALPGTGTIVQALKPRTNAVTSQGVALARVDKVQAKGITGKGVTVGAISDSYDVANYDLLGNPLKVHAAQDIKSGDLPGKGNPNHPTPVAVVEDLPVDDYNTDEGRAMLQVVHDVAPGSRLCFATGATGQLGFAENIRRLADKKGKCGADIVTDDLGYADEPMFSDSAISDAIDAVAAKGVDYFSSAGNSGEAQAWSSPVRLIPAQRGLRGTNLDFSNVDPALYDGGLQDMNPGAGTDVAQNLKLDPDYGGEINLQWDDPVDADGPTLGTPFASAKGTLTSSVHSRTFKYNVAASEVGKLVSVTTDAVPSGSIDLVLSVDAPDGTNLGTVDTYSSPETLVAKIPAAGTYSVTVSGFDDAAVGDFTVSAAPVLAPSTTSTDFNVLLFDGDGNYVGNMAEDNLLTGHPYEIAPISGLSDVQMVIARHGTGAVGATRLRNVLNGSIQFSEYADALAPAIYGHPMARGATAVAAYGPFRPYLAESFTAPGGDLPIVFDSAGERLRKPEVRRVPQVAGADGGNNTFLGIDNARDPDTLPNFFGTSASAPHVAGIAALALEKAGGPKSLTPDALRSRLERSTYTHDLDPSRASGSAGGLSISAAGVPGDDRNVLPGAMNDPKFFTLKYAGKVPLKSVTFYGETASPTALGRRHPPYSDGIVFDTRHFDGVTPYRTDGFPFTIGSTSGGLAAAKVAASFSVPGGGESVAGQWRHMTLKFAAGLKAGQGLQFGVDRDLAVSGFGGSNEGDSADELGGATLLPQDTTINRGLGFVAERTDGTKILGLVANRLGHGWTPVDGYGLVNAQKAVLGSR